MRIAVTGASGFLGRFVVAEALERGHEVVAFVRPASDLSPLPWIEDPRVQRITVDLRAPGDLDRLLIGCEAVLHLAAAKSGDLHDQLRGTVVATESLLEAMVDAGVDRIIVVSSLAVYEYLGKRGHSVLRETSELDRRVERRDAYAQTKLLQEQLVREYAEKHHWRLTVLRPGTVFGKDNLWTARIGMQGGPSTWVRLGSRARIPLTYVENCADAILDSAECTAAIGQTFNIIDDAPPTQKRYAAELRDRLPQRPRIIAVPWTFARLLARIAWIAKHTIFGGRLRLPGVLVPARLHARFKPLRYSNEALKEVLNWTPRYSLEEALSRSLEPAAPSGPDE